MSFNRLCHYRLVMSMLLGLYLSPASAQDQHKEVSAVVTKLFDGMRAGDSTIVRSVFTKGCILTSISKDQADSTIVRSSNIEGFVKAVGTAHSEKWDERIYNINTSVDEPMATVWAPYQFYLGEKFSHCGVNAFTLIKTNVGWKISGITDTRRKENCLPGN